MKTKIMLGIVSITLSSFAMSSMGTGISSSDLSRSPFRADRDKANKALVQAEHPTPAQSISQGDVKQTEAPPSVAQPTHQYAAPNPSSARLKMVLQENHLLSQDIQVWAKAQGMHLLWNSNRDYLIYSSITLTGKSRDEVLNQLGQLFRSENYGLVVKLYEKNNVLVIDGQ